MNRKKELMNFLQSLDGDELRNLADGSLPEEMAVDAYIASNHVPDVGKTIDEKVERFEKVSGVGKKIDEILEDYYQKKIDLLEVRKRLLMLSPPLNPLQQPRSF